MIYKRKQVNKQISSKLKILYYERHCSENFFKVTDWEEILAITYCLTKALYQGSEGQGEEYNYMRSV